MAAKTPAAEQLVRGKYLRAPSARLSPVTFGRWHCRTQGQLCRRTAVCATVSAPETAQGQALQTVDEANWNEKYEAFGTLQYGVSLTQGRRESMEDTAVVIPKARCGYLFAAVFDGHNGSQAAQYLSKELYSAFSDAIDDQPDAEECAIEETDTSGLCCPLEFTGVLRQSFIDMDIELLKWLEENTEGEEISSGATATVVLARKDKVVIANVGDSRAVLSRNGKPVDLSAEHRVAGKSEVVESETERIKEAGGWVEHGRVCDLIAVSRAFGDRFFKHPHLQELGPRSIEDELWTQQQLAKAQFTNKDLVICKPDVTELALAEGDEFLILATDGLWDVLSSKDAVKIAKDAFQKQRSSEEIAQLLTERAYRKYSEDNIAVVVVDLGGPAGGWEASKPTGGLRGLFGQMSGK